MATTKRSRRQRPSPAGETGRSQRQERRAAAPGSAIPPAAGAAGRRGRRGLGGLETAVSAGVVLAILGGSWDVAWHIRSGRESFWSPPHLVLYAGLLVILGACGAAFATAWRRGQRWPAPGASIASLGAALALASAPIDELWHRLYGMDLTIWSPPHVMLVAGVAIAAFGALAGFCLRASRYDPQRLATLWRSTAGSGSSRGWGHGEVGFFVAGGMTLAVVLGVLGEYDFDVSRYPVVYHPILLAGLGATVLVGVARAGGRVGGATLAAAGFTLVRLLVHGEVFLLTGLQTQIPLVLLAAPVIDVALWRLSAIFDQSARRPIWPGAGLAGVGFSAVLLLVQWPYSVAANTLVWTPSVVAVALFPALLAGAAGAMVGWAVGTALRQVGTAPAGRAARRAPGVQPAVAWNGWTGWPGLTIFLALAGLIAVAIIPAAANGGAPRALDPPLAEARGDSVGLMELNPAVPVAGRPLTVRLTITNPSLINTIPPILPFESPHHGDLVTGTMRAGSQPGTYEATFTPREPGRRWLSVTFPVEEVRHSASAWLVVYRPHEAAGQAPLTPRPLVLRPNPGPDADAPGWLEPATYAALAVVIGAVLSGVALSLRRAGRVEAMAAAA